MADGFPPLTFRAQVIEPLLHLARAGESVALVGVAGTGKSNLARFLTRADVRLHYLGERAAQTMVLYCYCKSFAHEPPDKL